MGGVTNTYLAPLGHIKEGAFCDALRINRVNGFLLLCYIHVNKHFLSIDMDLIWIGQ